MENKKNNTWLYLIIVVLVAVTCLLVGFIFGNILLSNDGNNVEYKDDVTEDEIIPVSEVEGKALFEKVTVYNDYFTKDYLVDGLNNVSNNKILYFLVSELEGFGGYLSQKSGFSSEDLQEVADNYFLDDIKITYTDILFPGYEQATLFYLGDNGKYTFNTNLAVGGPGSMIMKEFYVDGSYNKSKDVYTINTKLLFDTWCSDTCMTGAGSFYSDSDLTNVVYTNDTDRSISLDSVYELVKDKLPITSFEFKKNNSQNYVLSSVKVK